MRKYLNVAREQIEVPAWWLFAATLLLLFNGIKDIVGA